jgi:L-ascorbate metabolism protein UlaG (beta-lactamase superfamily)
MKSRFFKSLLSACVTLILLSGTAASAGSVKKDKYVEKKGITIEYFGHASFGIGDSEGMKVVTDPYDPMVGFEFPAVSTQVHTLSHDHFDHNYTAALQGYEQLINAQTGRFTNGDVKIEGFASWHDTTEGSERGPNTIYTYEINNIRVCHLGDLGHQLSRELINSIGRVDVLMIPVGGFFTINSEEAIEVINSLNPKAVIPMHYLTDASPIFADYLAPVDDFTSKIQLEGWKVENADTLTLTKQMLNTMECRKVFVLNYN